MSSAMVFGLAVLNSWSGQNLAIVAGIELVGIGTATTLCQWFLQILVIAVSGVSSTPDDFNGYQSFKLGCDMGGPG